MEFETCREAGMLARGECRKCRQAAWERNLVIENVHNRQDVTIEDAYVEGQNR